MTTLSSRPASESRALITGASVGIGRELVRVFAEHGHPLVLVARNESRLNELAEELRQKHQAAVAVMVEDLSLACAASELVCELRDRSLPINILVNNAGFDVYGNFVETAWDDEEHLLH